MKYLIGSCACDSVPQHQSKYKQSKTFLIISTNIYQYIYANIYF